MMVKLSSTVDTDRRAFKALSQREATQGALGDDRPAASDSDHATLAPGLDDVEGLNASATAEEIERGKSTQVTRLEYDEYDPSRT